MMVAHELPNGFTVKFRFCHAALETEWHPRRPTREEFSALLESYRGVREQFLQSLGLDVVVIER